MPYQPFKNMHVFKINLPLGKGNMKTNLKKNTHLMQSTV